MVETVNVILGAMAKFHIWLVMDTARIIIIMKVATLMVETAVDPITITIIVLNAYA